MKFRKRPVVIDAKQWNGKNEKEIMDFIPNNATVVGTSVMIKTLEGTMRASAGDWIVKGPKGEFYPVKPDIFAITYERCKDD